MGLIGGNTIIFNLPASGVVTTVNGGNDEDLENSYVKGDLQPEQDPANPPDNPFVGEATASDLACPITDGKAYCTNTAGVGYALEPKINGTASFVARLLYRWIWTEYMFYGSVQVNTHWVERAISRGRFLQHDLPRRPPGQL